MTDALRYAGQAVFYAGVMALVGWFASHPTYQRFPPDMAQIKLAFSHGADRKEPCRRLTYEEIAALPANERKPMDCQRERLPIHLQVVLDGETMLDSELAPTGLSSDGPARAYEIFELRPGSHHLILRLADSGRRDGFDYERDIEIDLDARQSLAVDFKADAGGFILE